MQKHAEDINFYKILTYLCGKGNSKGKYPQLRFYSRNLHELQKELRFVKVTLSQTTNGH